MGKLQRLFCFYFGSLVVISYLDFIEDQGSTDVSVDIQIYDHLLDEICYDMTDYYISIMDIEETNEEHL